MLARFLARTAAAGVQVVVETHSDHILNGIRLAVHSGKISHEDVKLYYFGKYDKNGQTINEVTSPRIDADGRIDSWPNGFFDEMDESLSRLLEPSKGKA